MILINASLILFHLVQENNLQIVCSIHLNLSFSVIIRLQGWPFVLGFLNVLCCGEAWEDWRAHLNEIYSENRQRE